MSTFCAPSTMLDTKGETEKKGKVFVPVVLTFYESPNIKQWIILMII